MSTGERIDLPSATARNWLILLFLGGSGASSRRGRGCTGPRHGFETHRACRVHRVGPAFGAGPDPARIHPREICRGHEFSWPGKDSQALDQPGRHTAAPFAHQREGPDPGRGEEIHGRGEEPDKDLNPGRCQRLHPSVPNHFASR